MSLSCSHALLTLRRHMLRGDPHTFDIFLAARLLLLLARLVEVPLTMLKQREATHAWTMFRDHSEKMLILFRCSLFLLWICSKCTPVLPLLPWEALGRLLCARPLSPQHHHFYKSRGGLEDQSLSLLTALELYSHITITHIHARLLPSPTALQNVVPSRLMCRQAKSRMLLPLLPSLCVSVCSERRAAVRQPKLRSATALAVIASGFVARGRHCT